MWRKWGNCFLKQHNNVIGRSRTGHSVYRFEGWSEDNLCYVDIWFSLTTKCLAKVYI